MDHNAEMDALRDQLADAGLIEVYTDGQGGEAYRLTPEGETVARQLAMTGDDGDPAMRLTPEGESVARQLAMSSDDGQDALMGALLGE